MKLDKTWPQLFTCPTDEVGLKKDDLGHSLFNPVFSDREKMVNCGCEGCKDCDMQDECPGPVEYVRKQSPATCSATCSMCGKATDEGMHLSLYVNGSEGIIACLSCRIALTNIARDMKSMAHSARLDGIVHERRRANMHAVRITKDTK